MKDAAITWRRTLFPAQEGDIHAKEIPQRNKEHITSIRQQEEEIQTEERRKRCSNHMLSV